MDKQEYDKYMDLIMSMTLDVKRGGISTECYLNNLKLMIERIEREIYERKIQD